MKKIISIMLSILLIYGMIFYAAGSNEWVNKVFTITALVSVCFMLFTKSFKEKLPKLIKEPIVIAMFSYLAIYILSMFWAKTGKMAFDEITKLILSMSVFIITLIAVNKDNMRFSLGFLSGVLGILGLLNIDLAGPKILSYPFIQIVNKIVPGINDYGIFLGNRIWTAFGNPNLFAPLMAVGLLIAAYLFMTSEKRSERLFSAIMMTFCEVAYIACVSLGSILALGVAFIVFIIFMEKEYRLKSLAIIIASFVISLIATILVFKILSIKKILLLSIGVMILFGIVNWITLFACEKLILKVNDKTQNIVKIVTGTVIGLLAIYLILALNLTGTFDGERISVKRAFYPKQGEYVLRVDSDKEVDISVYTQNLEQAQSYISDTVFKGKVNGETEKKFSVDEDVKVAYIYITSNGANLNKIEVVSSEGKVINIPLKYRLLPEFIADRLQGLRANQSMLQRIVFWEDGLKIFAKSPVVGNGIGAFETDVDSVRNINYETRYPHNIAVKVLLETGIIGFIIFIGLIISIYYTLLRKETSYKQLKATLLATITMLIGHSLIEVNMNYAVIISVLFILFAITVIAFHQEQKSYRPIKEWKIRVPIIVVAIFFVIMYISNLQGYNYLLQENKGNNVFDTLKMYMTYDPFNKADYLFSYLNHAEAYGEEELKEEALTKLRDSYAYTTCEHIEEYYKNDYDIDSLFKLSRIDLEKNRTERNRWGIVFQNYESLMKTSYIEKGNLKERYNEIVNEIIETYDELRETNEELYNKIVLYDRNRNLIARALKARELLGVYSIDETIRLLDAFVYDSSIVIDENNDGINDNYKISKDKRNITFTAFIKASRLTKFAGIIELDNPDDVTRVLIGNKPSELKFEDGKVLFEIKTQGEGHLDVKIEVKEATKFNRIIINKEQEIVF